MFHSVIRYRVVVSIVTLALLGCFSSPGYAAQFKVLVVHSYHDTYEWTQGMNEGIHDILGASAEIRSFYMDTKRDKSGGDQKAQEAFAVYQEFQPDGVITTDDNAQSMFVVPYLLDKVATPIIFCGVNADPGNYGFPASNVTGVMERDHVLATIALAQQLDPSIKKIGYLATKSATGEAVLAQIQADAGSYPAEFVEYRLAETLDEALTMATELKKLTDAIYSGTFRGMRDKDGNMLDNKQAMLAINKAFGKPILCGSAIRIKHGALCAVAKTGQEQGRLGAKLLLQSLQGTPVADIPMIRNTNGKRFINVTALRELGIKPPARAILGAELIKTEE